MNPERTFYPYLFAPFQSDLNRPLFVFLPGMDETGKELMMLQVAGLDAIFDVRCFVIQEKPVLTLIFFSITHVG